MENSTKDLEKMSEEERQHEYRKIKLHLEELQKRKKKSSILYGVFSGVFAGAFCSIFIYVLDIRFYDFSVFKMACMIFFAILFGILVALYMYMIADGRESILRRKMLEYEVADIQEEVQDDVFENSIKMSYKYLDQYYLQTREQAQKGFFVTVCVSVFGAILLGIGIIAMFLEKAEPSYVTCASGVITEFIAAIFFYLYNKTVTSMSKYHNKLVLSQNISIALKVADTLPSEDKTKSKNIIISELLKDINTYLIKSDSEKNKNDKE